MWLVRVERLRSIVLLFTYHDRCRSARSGMIPDSAEVPCPFVMAGEGRSWSGWVDVRELREIREIGDMRKGRRRMVWETWRYWSASTVSRILRIVRLRNVVWRGLGSAFLVRVMFWSRWSMWTA
jgi:hypothetical protein